jgi:hypothetical protein
MPRTQNFGQVPAISDEFALEFLLAFDGRIHRFDQEFWAKFEVKRVEPTPERPHGLRYSLTLHDPDGNRLLGFDNAHGVPSRGSRYRKPSVAHDHWHRTRDDEGRPYEFKGVVQPQSRINAPRSLAWCLPRPI